MFHKVYSAVILGIESCLVQVEVDVSDGLPGFFMVGYLASEVREAQERVRTAIKNSGFRLPPKRVTVNLSPANIRKDGTGFDLPIAVGVLAAFGLIPDQCLKESIFVGELGLNGEIKGVPGALVYASMCQKEGIQRCFLPQANAEEGALVESAEIVGVASLKELVELLRHPENIQIWPGQEQGESQYSGPDFSEVGGQLLLRRAVEIGVSGMHNILMIGPAGCGKSMIAERIPSIMPPLSRQESMEVSKLYSVCGLLPADQPLKRIRPFRAPHHTISPYGLAGGGKKPKPGELSLASKGVLFLDELPEFSRDTLEVLRLPLEQKKITISRLYGAFDFPADFILLAAMNPCPCGFYPDRTRCSCSEIQISRYRNRISRPLLDRIDIGVEVKPVSYGEIKAGGGESSAQIRKRVEQVWEIQRKRFQGTKILFNSAMSMEQIKEFCQIDQKEEAFLERVFQKKGFSARACSKILKVARTIADMEGSERLLHEHLCEAIGYRALDGIYWRGATDGR